MRVRPWAVRLSVAAFGAPAGLSMAAAGNAPRDQRLWLASSFDALIFDKDGTLLDFSATWDRSLFAAIQSAAPDDVHKQQSIASALGFSLESQTCLRDAPVIYKSNKQLEEILAPLTDGRAMIDECAAQAISHATETVEATAVLRALRTAGIPTAVATNDEEHSARCQLDALAWLEPEAPLLAAVLGCDSGHGSKPEAGMVRAAAARLDVDVAQCAYVGDAATDMQAARAAGCAAAILVGPPEDVGHLAHLADYWIHDLRGLLQPPAGSRVVPARKE